MLIFGVTVRPLLHWQFFFCVGLEMRMVPYQQCQKLVVVMEASELWPYMGFGAVKRMRSQGSGHSLGLVTIGRQMMHTISTPINKGLQSLSVKCRTPNFVVWQYHGYRDIAPLHKMAGNILC